MSELKPCPFCGRNLLDLQYEDREDRGVPCIGGRQKLFA